MAKAATDVFQSLPVYSTTSEETMVDLSPDGLPCIPVLGDTHYSRSSGGTTAHVHPGMIEILCCRKGGNLSFDYGGEIHPFRPGDVLVAQPGVPHFLRTYPKSLSMHWLWFRLPSARKAVLGLSVAETRWLVARLRALPVRFVAGEPVKRAFRRLWRLYTETPRRDAGRRLLLRDAVLHLLLRLTETAEERREERDHAALDALIAEMRRAPAEAYPIEDLARRLAMSVPKLIDLFRRRTGLPPHAFLVACRMAQARDALATTRQTIHAIARRLGFPSAQHFATQFRRDTGLSPRAWRTQNTKKTPKTA